MEEGKDFESEPFYPKGAIAFFIVMIVVFMLMWFSIYFDVVGRV